MLKFLLIFIAIIYLVGYVGRLFLRNWLRKMQDPSQQANNRTQSRPEGEVFVEKQNSNKKHFKKDDGDYIEYEEVK